MIYTHDDFIGVEIAGALKNVLAIDAGMVEGYGYGYNITQNQQLFRKDS